MSGNILIFGEVLADIFPERSVLGGAPFNAARHLQAFGLHPLMISSIGNDKLGDNLLAEMDKLGMDTVGMQFDMQYPTGQVNVLLENGSHRFEILPDQAYDHINRAVALEILEEYPPDLFYCGTLAQRSLESRMTLEALSAECDCPVFLDINLRAPWYDKGVILHSLDATDILKINDEELTVVAEILGIAGDAQAQANALQQKFALQQVLVTCGEQGSWLLDAEGRVHQSAPVKLGAEFVDSVGAGDAYAAVFMLGLLRNWPLQTTLDRANQFAAAICMQRGAAISSPELYDAFQRFWP